LKVNDMKSLLLLVLSLICTIVSGGCSRTSSNDENGESRAPVVNVIARPIARGDIEETLGIEGKTVALRMEKLVSPIAGSIVAIKGIEGSPVRAGDTLAVVRSRESQAAIDGANALLREARTQTQREEARKSLELAVSSQAVAVIRAAGSGIIESRLANEGEVVSENAELFEIIDPSSIYFAADIPLSELRRVKPGQSCRIRFPSMPGLEVDATVGTIEPAANQQSQSVRARLVFGPLRADERSLLKTDMFGSARIVTGVHRGVLLVPPAALLRDDETNSVSIVVVGPDSISKSVQVQTGAARDSVVEVSGPGLSEGQLVVTEGNYGLPDSTRVRLKASEKP
jgi:RND family efflux transporter MFP subunit